MASLLSSGWRLKGYIGEDWRWRDAHLPETRDPDNWIEATVPGSVHYDLWQAGLIADPYRGQNTLLAEWVSARTWVYRNRFTVDAALEGRRMQLCFEGVDYEADFYLNGEALGRHASMFTPATFDVGHLLNYGGENVVAVVLQPAPHEQPQVGRSSLVRTHKTRMNYWWDFCPRLVHLGLWDEVMLRDSGPVRIEDVVVRAWPKEDYSQATIEVAITVSSLGEPLAVLEVTETSGFRLAAARLEKSDVFALPAGVSQIEVQMQLENPRLWWPNGYGEQWLYELDVRVLLDPGGEVSDSKRVTFGVRDVEFVPNEGAPEEAMPYTLAVNGRKIYIQGWNWVPMDLLYGVERPEKRERLLRLAQRANVNVLRVWGGGLIEKEAFYKLCDEMGLFVWQEFIQSSSGIENVPPADFRFVRKMEEEARQIVPRRRNHPSLLLWCGGNELQDAQGLPQSDAHPLLRALKTTVWACDPQRHWLPTSPSGPRFGNTLENIEEDSDGLHDVHGPWIYEGLEEQYTLFNRGTSLLNSEFGVEGITNLRTLNDVMPEEQQRPIRRANQMWHHLGAWWIWEAHWDEFWGGLVQRETAQVVRAAQFLQAEGLRYAVEANRRRKFRNSGSLPWQFNEPYPMAACTSAVDYYAQPKPVYYAVARAYAPLTVSARFARLAWGGEACFEASIWTSNSREALDDACLQARLVGADGNVWAEREWAISVEGNASQVHGEIKLDLTSFGNLSGHDGVFFLDLALQDVDGAMLARNRYPFSCGETLGPMLDLAGAALEVRVGEIRSRVPGGTLGEIEFLSGNDAWRLTIANKGEQAAPGVWLDVARGVRASGYAYFDDNFIHLLPGEQRTLTVIWDGIPPKERAIGLQALNAEERIFHG